MNSIRIATRKSPLALWQANFVKEQLKKTHSGLKVKIISMSTSGDQMLDRRLNTNGGKGLFLKELETTLLNGSTDIAVHSMKDVPVELPHGLEIPVVCGREDPRDAFVSNEYQNLYALPAGAKVGTSSLRRVAQLKSAFPALEFYELRGNVNTRLSKLDKGVYDAIILAAAGLIRLGLDDRIKQYISPDVCLPAVGQGIVGIECRSQDKNIIELIQPLHSLESALVLEAERAMNSRLDGGCQVPVAGFAEINKGKIHMRGVVGKPDGSLLLNAKGVSQSMSSESSIELGQSLANELLKQGASDLLKSLGNESSIRKAPLTPDLVLLTRQDQFLGNTINILERLDYHSAHIPTLKIEPNPKLGELTALNHLSDYTDILFVSRNAVEVERGGIPDGIRVMTMGAETAKQIYGHGIDAMFPNIGVGAEALLKVKHLQDFTGRKVLVVRGNLGLDWPAEEMRRRGAEVDQLYCYIQMVPEGSADKLADIIKKNQAIDVIFIHSANSLLNLMEIAAEHKDTLIKAKLVAGSHNIARSAKALGWQGEVNIAESPSNKHMIVAISS